MTLHEHGTGKLSHMAKRLLTLLLDKYETSKSYKDQAVGQRRVALSPKAVRGLNLEDYEQKESFIAALKILKIQEVADYEWQPFEDGNLVKRFWLAQDAGCIERAYHLLDRPVTYRVKSEVMDELWACEFQHYGWLQVFKRDVLLRFEKTGKYGNLLMADDSTSLGLIRLLKTLDLRCGEPIHERLLSASVFGDTKVFQRVYKPRFKAIVARYAFNSSDFENENENKNEKGDEFDEVYPDEDTYQGIWSLLGIYSNPEIIQFKGNMRLHMPGGDLDTGLLTHGVGLLGRTVPTIQAISGNVDRVLLIENQACYEMAQSGTYSFLNAYMTPSTLVVYQGGFSSRIQALFYAKVYEAFPRADYLLWSDIDLGGARIYANLKKDLPSLKTLFMDEATVEANINYCIPLAPSYAKKVAHSLEEARRLASTKMDSEYTRILTLIHRMQLRMEQEVLGMGKTGNRNMKT